MFYIKFLLNNFIRCNESNALKLCILKLRNPRKNKKDFFDRIKYFFKAVIFPVYKIKFKKKNNCKYCFIEPSFLEDKELVTAREKYLFEFQHISSRPIYWTKDIIISNIKDIFIFLKYYFIGIFYSFFALFDFYNISYKHISDFFLNLIIISLVKPNKLYLFNPHDLNNYLLHLFFLGRIKTYYNFGNSPLYELKRYGFFKNVNIILCSKAHLDEFNSYLKLKWIKLQDCEIDVWGNEYIDEINRMNRKLLFELGFFSSAEWARNGLSRAYDIDNIQNGKYLTNERWKFADKVLLLCIKLVKQLNLKLKIYLHPHEKFLIKEYKIYPPYWNEVDNKNIFSDYSNDNQKSNFFEVKYGVAYFTSVVYDRSNYNLDTFFYVSKNDPTTLFANYLNKYSYLKYSNLEELEKKILQRLKTV